MPYIAQPQRTAIDKYVIDDFKERVDNAGELSYLLTKIIFTYFKTKGGRYAQINDVVGALEGAKLEFYRRVAAPYEDGKIKENGDVY